MFTSGALSIGRHALGAQHSGLARQLQQPQTYTVLDFGIHQGYSALTSDGQFVTANNSVLLSQDGPKSCTLVQTSGHWRCLRYNALARSLMRFLST